MTTRYNFALTLCGAAVVLGIAACATEDSVPQHIRAESEERGCVGIHSYVLDLDPAMKDGASGAFWCVYSESGTPPPELVFLRAAESLGCPSESIPWTRPLGELSTTEIASRSLDSFTPANTQLGSVRGVLFNGPVLQSVANASVATIVCYGGEWYYDFTS